MAEKPDWLPSCDLDEGAMPIACLVIVLYLDAETGQQKYGLATKGESSLTTYLGMTVIAQGELKKWSYEGE